MQFSGLLFEKVDEIFDSTINNIKKKLQLSDEEFNEKLKERSEDLAEIYENTLLAAYFKNYLIPFKEFIKNTNKTVTIISAKHDQCFHLYFTYINACFVVLERIKQNVLQQSLEPKDSVILSLYGYLYRIADQIGIMLLNGYPDGALRLWRSFYDHAIVLSFMMREYTNELANKFIDHGLRYAQKKAHSFNQHAEDLQFEKVEDEILNNYKDISLEFETKYGKDFLKEEYSWAKTVFNKEKVSFRDIEEYMGMSRYRPFYIWASSYSHCSFESMHDFENNERDIVIDNITQPETEIDAFVDPMQITIAVFHDVNALFIERYSDESECWLNIRLFEEFLLALQNSFTEGN